MLIGLHGRMQSGKDTAASFIEEWCEDHEREYIHESFAAKLKISAARALGFEGEDIECIDFCNELKLNGEIQIHDFYSDNLAMQGWSISGREFLQLYGTEAHRGVFGTDFWVDACLPDQYDYSSPEIRVVTDVRFPNEAERIHALGGEVWHIIRPSQGENTDGHASEVPLDDSLLDVHIINDRDLNYLRERVVFMLQTGIHV